MYKFFLILERLIQTLKTKIKIVIWKIRYGKRIKIGKKLKIRKTINNNNNVISCNSVINKKKQTIA
jgi:hypothetical protein